ncbi:MAG: acyltransferase [Variovorax sp.]|nr:MAG: acyltransferase [Variovorax sp.]
MQPNPAVENLKALTSLRFVAALMIMAHHAPHLFRWEWIKGAPASLVHGVSFFFVLSGFILTHVYSSKPLPRYSSFVRARFARLWPVHIVATIFLALTVADGSITFDGPGLFDKWVVLGFNLALVHAIFPFLAYTFSWNSVSWSISTEMFFYLVFPLLIVNIERTWHWKLLGAGCLAALTIGVLALAHVPITGGFEQVTATYATYPSPLMRGFEFSLGMAAWVLWKKYLRSMTLSTLAWSVIELASVCLCLAWISNFAILNRAISNPWILLWMGPAGSCWAFAVLIVVFATGGGVLSRMLTVRPMVFLGEISFSIYMLHLVLMKVFVTTLAWPEVPEVVYFSALLALASASYLLVEKPAQRLLLGKSARFAKSPALL